MKHIFVDAQISVNICDCVLNNISIIRNILHRQGIMRNCHKKISEYAVPHILNKIKAFYHPFAANSKSFKKGSTPLSSKSAILASSLFLIAVPNSISLSFNACFSV